MKKFMIIAFLMLAVFVAACTPEQQNNEPKACTEEAKVCPDGSSVSRNSSLNCEFDACPQVKTETEQVMCPQDVKDCADGSFVSRNPSKGCSFDECPEIIICKTDTKTCPDGKKVSRDPKNGCEFSACAQVKNTTSTSPVKNTSTNTSNSNTGKEVKDDNSDVAACRSDTMLCEDGTRVGRDPENNCQFKSCPDGNLDDDYLPQSSYTNSPTLDNKHYCTTQQKNIGACQSGYAMNVCGFTDEEAQVNQFVNPCEACRHAQVQYWVEGACTVQ